MKKYFYLFIVAVVIFIIDQYIKMVFLNGYRVDSDCISLILTLNRGVAFSMFSFLGESLKYIQVGVILIVLIYLLYEKEIIKKFPIPIGLILGAGISNIYDRFSEGAVVDYIFWHCGFNFAIFNFADVMIDIGIGVILLFTYLDYRKSKKG